MTAESRQDQDLRIPPDAEDYVPEDHDAADLDPEDRTAGDFTTQHPTAQHPTARESEEDMAGQHAALRERWQAAQLRFVDDPRGAAEEARALAEEALHDATERVRALGAQQSGDDTEQLRQLVAGYRDVFDRMASR